ncbi:MAG: biopolymer transporter ExbD [Pseudomonadota bacterium]
MKFQRNLKSEVSVDITPLIDVVFILLLFFMVTTSFDRDTNLVINLPTANGQAVAEAPLQIDIQIDRAGVYAVNGSLLADNAVETVITAIEGLAAGDQSIPITITADANTTHQAVVTALDAVARMGFTRVNIATVQAEAE